jgi:hypothetical protein
VHNKVTIRIEVFVMFNFCSIKCKTLVDTYIMLARYKRHQS